MLIEHGHAVHPDHHNNAFLDVTVTRLLPDQVPQVACFFVSPVGVLEGLPDSPFSPGYMNKLLRQPATQRGAEYSDMSFLFGLEPLAGVNERFGADTEVVLVNVDNERVQGAETWPF